MPDYVITIARSARKELERLSSQQAERILKRIEGLISNPRPVASLKLKG
jgi:mRNA-degrading endonuclease RelE of RelBE toxin-antitoxin system